MTLHYCWSCFTAVKKPEICCSIAEHNNITSLPVWDKQTASSGLHRSSVFRVASDTRSEETSDRLLVSTTKSLVFHTKNASLRFLLRTHFFWRTVKDWLGLLVCLPWKCLVEDWLCVGRTLGWLGVTRWAMLDSQHSYNQGNTHHHHHHHCHHLPTLTINTRGNFTKHATRWKMSLGVFLVILFIIC